MDNSSKRLQRLTLMLVSKQESGQRTRIAISEVMPSKRQMM